MLVKLLCSRAGIDFAQNAGDEVEIADAEAIRMIDAGQAVPVAPKIERAVKAPAKETRKK